MDPQAVFFLGAAAAAVPMLLLVLALWKRGKQARRDANETGSEADKLREVLAASPDGLFMFDITNGREICSRRLAVLLGLADGVDSTYYDLRHVFEDEASASFDKAVGALRHSGAAFDLLLPVRGRLVHVVGVRAGNAAGEPLADLLWMRDVDGIPGAMAPAAGPTDALKSAYDSFQYLLDALPIPVWLRDSELSVAFTNRACAGTELAAQATPLAEQARAEGAAKSGTLAGTEEDSASMRVTETPVKGWIGTAGFAMAASESADRSGGVALPRSLEEVLRGLSTAVSAFGPDRRLEFFNPAYAALWRLDAAWLDERPPMAEILDRMRGQRRLPEVADFRAFKEDRLALFAEGQPHEETLHLPDNSTISSRSVPRPDGGLIFVDEDVSDRLSLERDVATLEMVRRETLENLHEGIAVFGGDGRLRLTNPKLMALWGLTSEVLPLGIHVTDFVESMRPLLAGIQDWETHKGHVVATLTARESGAGRLVRRDGTILDYANVPLPDGAVLVCYLDVTDSAKVEMALRERAVALDEAGKLKSTFIANVSHEIRTPMNTIIGFAETLAEEYFGELNRRQKEYTEGILDSAQGLMRVIGDILDLASIEAGTLTLELDTIDLQAMLVSVLGLVRERARRHGLKLEFDCPADIGWMVGDERRVKQVVLNLLSNAIRFTPNRGTVKLIALRENDDIVLKVTDTGVGIPAAEQEAVFQPFQRTRTTDYGTGAGLGLSIVRQFVELHGGGVRLTSQPGKGTSVTCRLPAAGLIGDDPVYPAAGLDG